MKGFFQIYIYLILNFVYHAQETKNFELTVQRDLRYPDGFYKTVITTNGQFTAPELRVNKGDIVRATFFNNLISDVFTIHFHGILQRNSPWYDGVYMGTQCSILDQFTYEFTIYEEPGTYMYHSHQGGFRMDGLQGPFIVEDTPALKEQLGYDEEYTMMIVDWYHEDIDLLLLQLRQPVESSVEQPPYFIWPGYPDSLLINGKGYWNSSQESIVTDQNFNQSFASFETFKVESGKKYMFRIIGGMGVNIVNVWVQGHSMTIVRADGQLVQPITVESLILNSGERYDVIIEANQPKGHYWIQLETRFGGSIRGWALLSYEGTQDDVPTVFNPTGLDQLPANPLEEWDPNLLLGVEELNGDMAQLYPDRTLVIGFQAKEYPDAMSTGKREVYGLSLNKTPPQQSIPYYETSSPLMHILYKNRCDQINSNVIIWPNVCDGEKSLKPGEIVDIVFNNYPAYFTMIEQHPWHLHGYTFYVLGYGPGNFSYEDFGNALNLKNPVKRDTVTVYPSFDDDMIFDADEETFGVEPYTPSGWAVIRFTADNPGVWNLHCHFLWHLFEGMQMFIVDDIDGIPEPPSELLECGPVQLFE